MTLSLPFDLVTTMIFIIEVLQVNSVVPILVNIVVDMLSTTHWFVGYRLLIHFLCLVQSGIYLQQVKMVFMLQGSSGVCMQSEVTGCDSQVQLYYRCTKTPIV